MDTKHLSALDDVGAEPQGDTPRVMPSIPRGLLAAYSVEETLGAGAMGVVYRATHLGLQRPVALKLPTLSSSEDVARFVREGRILAGLQHPNLVRVYDAGDSDGRPYIALEFVRGVTLSALADGQALPVEVAVWMAVQLLEGIGHAHAHGVLHRDVKGDNALVTTEGVLKLADFGLARLEQGESHTRLGTIMGTPSYMAPEQAKGEAVDARADLYSAGVVLFELLSGRLPFVADKLADLLAMQIHQPPPPLTLLVPGVPTGLMEVVECSLAKARDERFSTAAEFITRLRGVVKDEKLERGSARSRELVGHASKSTQTIAGTTFLGIARSGESEGEFRAKGTVRRTARRNGRSAEASPSATRVSANRMPPREAAGLPIVVEKRYALRALVGAVLLAACVAGIPSRRSATGPALSSAGVVSLREIAWAFEPQRSRLQFKCQLSAPVLSGFRIGNVDSHFPNGQPRADLDLEIPYEPGAPLDIQALRTDGGPSLRWTRMDLVDRLREVAARSRTGLQRFWKRTGLTDQALVDRLRFQFGSRSIPPGRRAEASRRLKDLLERDLEIFAVVRDLLPLAPLIFDDPSLRTDERLATYKALAPLAVVDATANAFGLNLPWVQNLSQRMGRSFGQISTPTVRGLNNYGWHHFEGKEILGAASQFRIPPTLDTSNLILGAQFRFDTTAILKIVVDDIPLYFDLQQRYYTPRLYIPVLHIASGGKTPGPREYAVDTLDMATLAHAVGPLASASGNVRISVSAIWIHPPTIFERNRVGLLWLSLPQSSSH